MKFRKKLIHFKNVSEIYEVIFVINCKFMSEQ